MSDPTYDQQIAQLAATSGNNGEINQELVEHVISLSKRTSSQASAIDITFMDSVNAFKR